MVDEFQKQYSALSIPYPPDTVSPQIDALEKEIKGDIEKFKTESNIRIAEYVFYIKKLSLKIINLS